MQIGSLPIPQTRELQALFDATKLATPAGAQSPAGAGKPAFDNFLERAISEVDGTMKAADTEKTKLFTGETNNLHQAMIAMQEASVAFSLMVEVRNKLVEGYQEIMRMQV